MWFTNSSFRALGEYEEGVFNGCTPGAIGHAVTVVGYGREGGQDYWLVKNSWGIGWGDNGYFKLRRGVGACSIGQAIAIIDCAKNTNVRGAAQDCEEGDESCAAEQEEGEEGNAEDGNTEDGNTEDA